MNEIMGSVTMQLIRQVAAYTDTDAVELPPLYDTIDPDALETCITQMEGVDLSFEFAGVPVTVESTGEIELGAESSAATILEIEDYTAQTTDLSS